MPAPLRYRRSAAALLSLALALLVPVSAWTAPSASATKNEKTAKVAKVAKASKSPPATTVANLYRERAREFEALASAFQKHVGTMPASDAGTRALREAVVRLRDSYKGMEFLTAHLHEELAERLNPAPIDQPDPTPGSLTVLKPAGLQVLLETAYGDDPWADRARLAWLAEQLASDARALVMAANTPLDDHDVFAAMEAQVLRVMTMGIAGFDAPAMERALPESRLSLLALKPALDAYLPGLRAHANANRAALARRLASELERAIRQLDGAATVPAFDRFNRLAYIRGAGNPLYAAIIDARSALGIHAGASDATGREADGAATGVEPPSRRPVSYTARNLFAPDFLDPYFYSRVSGKKPGPAVATLGKKLFFDPRFSLDNQRSCASCHDPRKAFTDGLPTSPGFGGHGNLTRNAPTITHAAYQSALFWDMREETLEKQILQVVAAQDEFRNDFPTILGRLGKDPEYPALFRAAFRDPAVQNAADTGAMAGNITVATVTTAIAQYLRSLDNWHSPFDRYVRGETRFLDPAAQRGFNLFMGKALCATCHFPPAFNGVVPPRYVDTESEVLGTPEVFPAAPGTGLVLDNDIGRGVANFSPVFKRAFKTPSVRNAALTAPYMHNGSMATLEDVLDFYNAGGGQGLGLDVPNQTLPADSLGLSRRDMNDIIAFLKSLTDTTAAGHGAGVGY